MADDLALRRTVLQLSRQNAQRRTSPTTTSGGGGGGGVTDGDKGDITVSGGGSIWTVDPAVIPVVDQALSWAI